MLGAINKATQTLPVFRQITGPLKLLFSLSFGYMIAFKDGHYYTLIDNLRFLNKFVREAKKSSIFREKSIRGFDYSDYHINIWPEIPSSEAMDICFHYNLWNGITISRPQEDFVELWWFTGESTSLQDFFLRNKRIFIKFIDYFNYHKTRLFIPTISSKQDLFRFAEGFDIGERGEEDIEAEKIKRFLAAIKTRSIVLRTKEGQVTLSPREIEVMALTASGLTAKLIAAKMNIADGTVRHYIENIKFKLDIHQKSNLIGFYFDNLKKIVE